MLLLNSEYEAAVIEFLCCYHIRSMLRGYYEKPTICRQLYVFFMKLHSFCVKMEKCA